MKKILSLLVIAMILCMSLSTAFAKDIGGVTVLGVDSGLFLEVKEEVDIVTAVLKLRGPAKVTGFQAIISYPTGKLIPRHKSTTATYTSTSSTTSALTCLNYINTAQLSSGFFNGHAINITTPVAYYTTGYSINPLATESFLQFYSTPNYGLDEAPEVLMDLTSSDVAVLAEMKFNKIDSADIVEGDVALKIVNLLEPKIFYKPDSNPSAEVLFSTDDDYFVTSFTNYNPPAQDPLELVDEIDKTALDGTVDANTEVTFGGTVANLASNHAEEVGIDINNMKFPAGWEAGVVGATKTATTIKGGKFVIKIKGFTSLGQGDYVIKSYYKVGSNYTYDVDNKIDYTVD